MPINEKNDTSDTKMAIELLTIEKLPQELFKTYIFPELNNQDLVAFSGASRQLFAATRTERETRETSPLLQAVVQGNEAEAKRLLGSSPNLLLSSRGIATDYSGREFKNLTPFQAALCTLDIEMCEMMKEHFLQLKDGEAKMQAQFNQVFPDGLDAHIESPKKKAFNFDKILEAIIDASEADVTAALDKKFDADLPLIHALNKFRAEFQTQSLSEKVFNPYHILKAYKTYDAEFDNLGNWDKRALFWRQVLGFTQRLASDSLKQALAQGIYYIVVEGKALRRSFDFRFGRGDTLGLADSNFSGLGFDLACDAGLGGWVGRDGAGRSGMRVGLFKTYVKQKYQAWQNYSDPGRPTKRARHV